MNRTTKYAGSSVHIGGNITKQAGEHYLGMKAGNDAVAPDQDDEFAGPENKAGHPGYPRKTIVVFNTMRKGGGREYRVWLVTGRDFADGLRCPDKNCLHLDCRFVRQRFEHNKSAVERKVYYDIDEALKVAQSRFSHVQAGIKILPFEDVWPGIPCREVPLSS